MNGLPLNINVQQILLHLMNFTVLFCALYFLLYSPVKKFMKKRADFYAEEDARAAEGLKNAEASKAEYEKKLSEADAEIRALRENARAEAEKTAAARVEEAKNEAENILARAKEEAEREREHIISEAQSEIEALIAEGAEKLALEATTSDAYDSFLRAAERSRANARPN